MQVVGKRIVCDRCGKEIFLKYLDTDALDGGYTKIDKFEKIPEDWEMGFHAPNGAFIDLCPKCHNLLKTDFDIFMQNTMNMEE